VVTSILPQEWEGRYLGGSEKPVVYLDLDCRFDIRRLVHLLKCCIYDGHLGADDDWDMFKDRGHMLPTSSIKELQREQVCSRVLEPWNFSLMASTLATKTSTLYSRLFLAVHFSSVDFIPLRCF
jgi:DNA-repair protein XRCC2